MIFLEKTSFSTKLIQIKSKLKLNDIKITFIFGCSKFKYKWSKCQNVLKQKSCWFFFLSLSAQATNFMPYRKSVLTFYSHILVADTSRSFIYQIVCVVETKSASNWIDFVALIVYKLQWLHHHKIPNFCLPLCMNFYYEKIEIWLVYSNQNVAR